MFERGKGDREGPVEVEIALRDGQRLKGKLILTPGRSLPEVLNGTATFVEFQPVDGEHTFIAKSALHCVTPTNVPPTPDLWAGPTQGTTFDPYAILGIDSDSTREQAREAYLELAKAYHPDRYAATDLPQEVRNYLAIMVRRINAAHDALQTEQRRTAGQHEPVFTKAGQGQ
jgi:DnaJ-domain-containing protein 1